MIPLTLPEPEPVELLEAPVLPELVGLVEPLALEPLELVVGLVEPADAVPVVAELPEPAEVLLVVVAWPEDWVSVLRASAGSWPVTSTTVISTHTVRNRATDPATTRVRIMRTRARRASLILIPSSLVMDAQSRGGVAVA